MSHKKLFLLLFPMILAGCWADTEVQFKIIGTGFNKVKFGDSMKVFCKSSGSISGWSADLEVTRQVLGRVKMQGTLSVPKDTSLNCSLVGEEFSQLPFIPVYNNSQKSRYFKVLAPTKIQVRLHRKTRKVDNELYTHTVYKKFDHITNRNLVLESEAGRQVSNAKAEVSENWLE